MPSSGCATTRPSSWVERPRSSPTAPPSASAAESSGSPEELVGVRPERRSGDPACRRDPCPEALHVGCAGREAGLPIDAEADALLDVLAEDRGDRAVAVVSVREPN